MNDLGILRHDRMKRLLGLCLLSLCVTSSAMEMPIEDFSMQPYSQRIEDYLPPTDKDYNTPLVSNDYQTDQLQRFYLHYFSTEPNGLSPWSEALIRAVMPLVYPNQVTSLNSYHNATLPAEQYHYGENYKLHDEAWWLNVQQVMNWPGLTAMAYKEGNKAIAVENTMARELPELAPDFFHPTIAGQGFPFDNLQESALWAGTPLYVFNVSSDKEWSLVLTPDQYVAWVKSSDIAYVSAEFIQQWQLAAKKGLAAITKTGVSLLDEQQHFRLKGYIGAVFPRVSQQNSSTQVLIPNRDSIGRATLAQAQLDADAVALMPLKATKRHLAQILGELKSRPYGWGGMYFFNDCSQEMKSLFTPFAIWMPRNTTQQAKLSAAKDLSARSTDERLAALKAEGHPLMTLIYIGGHVMLYVGDFTLPHQGVVPVTYQNVWGLRNSNEDKRYLIGQSVFLPLLKQFPNNPDILSQAGREHYFKLIYLDALKDTVDTPKSFAQRFAG